MASAFGLIIASIFLPTILFYTIGLAFVGRLNLSLGVRIGGLPLALVLSAILTLILAPTLSVESITGNTLILGAFFGSLIALLFISLIGKRISQSAGTAREAPLSNADTSQDDDEEWRVLCEYDDGVRDAIELLRPYGKDALRELRSAHRIIGDKAEIPNISKKIAEKFRTEAKQKLLEQSPENLMKKYGIDFKSGKYTYLDFRYDKLQDAVAYARQEVEKRER